MQQVMRILTACAPAVEVGKVPQGILRVIPIIGGRFEGEKLRGTVLNVGADRNISHPNGNAHVYARYLLKTEDGAVIQIENEGVLSEDSGGFVTTPKFAADASGSYAWLNSGVYAGTLKASESPEYSVEITVFQL